MRPGKRYAVLAIAVPVVGIALTMLAGWMVEAWIESPGNLSVTTRFPGFIGASSRVIFVSLLTGLTLGIAAALRARLRLRTDTNTTHGNRLATIALFALPLTVVIGVIAIVLAERIVEKPYGIVTNYFAGVSRAGVLAIIATGLVGTALAVRGFFIRGGDRLLASITAFAHVTLLAMIALGQYAVLGYDQDRGATPAPGFLAVGRGYTAQTAGGPMQASSAGALNTADSATKCASLRAVRLVGPDTVRLVTERALPLAELRVTALLPNDSIIAGVPVIIEVEPVVPSVLYLFPARLANGLTAHSAGLFHIVVRSACADKALTLPARARRPRAE